MNAVDLGVYYDERKLNAIREHYEGTVEGYIEYQLNILFEEVVPYDEQNAIEELNLQEEIEMKKSSEENRRFSLNHILENGVDYYFTDEDAKTFYSAANIYRLYSRRSIIQNALPKDTLAQAHHFFRSDISKAEYDELLKQYGISKNIVSVLDFDLDNGTASVMLNGETQWHSYRLRDVSTAVFYTNKNKYVNFDFKEMKFNEHLEGKEMDSSTEESIGEQENGSSMQMC